MTKFRKGGVKMFKKKNYLGIMILLVFTLVFSGCSQNNQQVTTNQSKEEKEIPTLKIGYVYTNHQTPLMMAAHMKDSFKSKGLYLDEIIAKEKYTLIENEVPIANIELVVNKNGSETMTMMAQGHIDLALASNTAFITSRDQGNPVKILAPVHTEGIGLVVPSDSKINNWDDFSEAVKTGDKPFTVGYHSPTSAPLILLEAALKEAGITYSKNPEDINVNITLMDLKGTGNLIPAMTSGQVGAWVGPSPFPELALTENVGKIALDMKNLPPEGKWHDFPCCVIGTTEDIAKKNNHEVEKIVQLLTMSADYCSEHMDEAAEVTSEFTGVSIEAARLSTIKYTTNPTEEWIANMGLTYDTLKTTDNLSNELKSDSFEKAQSKLFDFSFIEKINNQR